MRHLDENFIGGAWRAASGGRLAVLNPATESPICEITLGTAADVDAAVRAARKAFLSYAAWEPTRRIGLLRRILEIYDRRSEDLAQRVTEEVGVPITFSREAQIFYGRSHLAKLIEVMETFQFDRMRGSTAVALEPIGVCGLITPWNWPLNQIVNKVGPALAAGCTMVMKPSEVAPLNAIIFAEILEEAGVPAGVFNLVQGDGATVGNAISSHPGIDMVSFTGSTRAGIQVARNAAETVKRVHQELGGKSAQIVLPDADLESAVTSGLHGCYSNAGQSCSAPTRMLVPRAAMSRALEIAVEAARTYVVGDPTDVATTMGPVINAIQYDKIQRLIGSGIEAGATLGLGGVGRPTHLNRGYFIQLTVFGNVTPDMAVAREEIFGPVLSIIGYSTEDEAVEIANDSVYGLAGYVNSKDLDRARSVARRIRAGCIFINNPEWDAGAPFGGYKQSGNGREYADFGLESFLEIKGMVGYAA